VAPNQDPDSIIFLNAEAISSGASPPPVAISS